MKTTNLLILLSVFCMAFSLPALAEPKAGMFGWWPGHWTWMNYKRFSPYLEKGKDTQNTQWDEQDWYVQDWISQKKDGLTLVDQWFRADILRKQDDEDGVAVLHVGPMFYRLSGYDKRRVMTTLDYVYGITDKGENAVILLKDWRTKKQIGVFTKDGLQIE